MTSATFLGTGNFLAPGRYWNSFVLDGAVLVEPSPTALPNLRRCGIGGNDIEAVVISHFHADHTFGWPFLLLELMHSGREGPIHVIGPAGVQTFLRDLMLLGGVPDVQDEAHRSLDLRYVEVDGEWQQAGDLRFRAVEVDHVAHLECYGYLFDRHARTIGYSGDTQPCDGLFELAAASHALVLECNGRHPMPTHMDIASVRALADRFPDLQLVLTHLGPDVGPLDFPNAIVPDDLQTVMDL